MNELWLPGVVALAGVCVAMVGRHNLEGRSVSEVIDEPSGHPQRLWVLAWAFGWSFALIGLAWSMVTVAILVSISL